MGDETHSDAASMKAARDQAVPAACASGGDVEVEWLRIELARIFDDVRLRHFVRAKVEYLPRTQLCKLHGRSLL